jgi:hypothetical protein
VRLVEFKTDRWLVPIQRRAFTSKCDGRKLHRPYRKRHPGISNCNSAAHRFTIEADLSARSVVRLTRVYPAASIARA